MPLLVKEGSSGFSDPLLTVPKHPWVASLLLKRWRLDLSLWSTENIQIITIKKKTLISINLIMIFFHHHDLARLLAL